MRNHYVLAYETIYGQYRDSVFQDPFLKPGDVIPHYVYVHLFFAQTIRTFPSLSYTGNIIMTGAFHHRYIVLPDPDSIGLRGYDPNLTSQPYARNMAALFIAHIHSSRTMVSNRTSPPFMDPKANVFFLA
jgi:hypothetical protein